jgi:beta-mannosidase
MTTVAGEDASRPPWPSCPANGWNSGVDALWGLPNGSPLGLKPRLAKPEPAPPLPVVGGPCEAQALTVARAMGCPGGTAGCTFVPNQDYDQGSMGPSASAPDAATCCTLCAARPDCEAATYVPGTCWFKTKAQTQVPGYNRDATGCWPPGHTPPPPSPPPPPSCAGLSYETHGYYQHGEGWRSVNSGGGLQPFDPNLPPGMPGPALTGTGCPGTYASEFGAVAISSWESMNPTLAPADWGLHNAAMSQRNYAVDNFVTAFANIPWPSGFDGVAGKAPFQKFLYFAMLGQALWIKSDIEGRRAQNSFGCVTWQFNEIWPTGGWGSIEYGTVGFTPGQVEGGRWKPLQYFMRRFIYRDHLIAAANDGRVLVRSDDAFGTTSATAAVSLLHVATGAVTPLGSGPVALPRGAAATTWLCTDGATAAGRVCPTLQSVLPGAGCAADGSDCVLLLNLTTTGGVFVVDNFELLAPLWKVQLPPATVTAAVGAPAADGTVPITLTASATALFVHLTTLAQGRFSDNSLILLPGNTVVSFLPWGPLDVGLLTTSLRVEHVKMYGVNGTAAV